MQGKQESQTIFLSETIRKPEEVYITGESKIKQINKLVTCEQYFDHEDTLNHAKSVLCRQILENLEDYISGRGFEGNLWLQTQ